ncbi:MAG: endonuclease/exonuclease/phosphatase family protein [Caldilineaceae bacterium]|nr:endonuclease/exonuclease/phosphatase family protein [Caldilineaceae bacterium]
MTNILPRMLRRLAVWFLWLYGLLLVGGWLLHDFVGDRLWWLALSLALLPLFLAPLLLLWPLGLWVRHPHYWLGLLPPTLLFFALYGPLFLPKAPPPYATEAPTLRVMTFNLWGGSYRARTAKVILNAGLPDVVALQELTPRMQRQILQTVGHAYPYHYFDRTTGARWLGILSRYPLEYLPTADLLLDLSCRQYRVRVDLDHAFRIYNCHPQSSNIFYFPGDFTMMTRQIEETFRLRTLLSQRLAQVVQAEREPTLVVGDFNTTDQSDAYRYLRTALLDSHRAIGRGFGHTFPAGTGFFRDIPIIERQVRIDMILYTADFVALQSQVFREHGESDHLPLLATLGWRAVLPTNALSQPGIPVSEQ